MPGILLGILLFDAQPRRPIQPGFIPTSVAIDLARQIVQEDGYTVPPPDKGFFDLITDKDNKRSYPGYVTVGFYINGRLISVLAMNERTGQVVDPRACQVYHTRTVRRLESTQQRASGAAPRSGAELLQDFGACETLTPHTRMK